ncbi:MAG: glycosyltransferase family 2 protein [Verrucomicrobia bacterium]|nr:glycosyltransferase family 2 protein [Verrucomicrobiota bacterium]MBU6446525.1 glycosyltransferase family 2 protein [Verrucomicrobiota bacterium]MDE3046918.1 glycosyltransferase family 92 protein [Verrucomicrobiota bacterium]
MKKKWLVFFLLICCWLPAKENRYFLSICAFFKNEAPFLREWIEYHKLLGVDHVYLYNNGSTDGSVKVLQPYIQQQFVTLVHWPDLAPRDEEDPLWLLSTKMPAYENALKRTALGHTKWLLFLSVDEFLVLPPDHSIRDFLQEFNDFPGLALASEFFDASWKGALPQRELVIESTEITKEPEQHPYRGVEKMIVKPDQCSHFTWPPYRCHFKDKQIAMNVSYAESRVQRYIDRKSFKPIHSVAKVLSFPYKLPEEEKKAYLKMGFEIEDQECLVRRFIPPLKQAIHITP